MVLTHVNSTVHTPHLGIQVWGFVPAGITLNTVSNACWHLEEELHAVIMSF